MTRARIAVLGGLAALLACDASAPTSTPARDEAPRTPAASPPPVVAARVAGATCTGRNDCPSDQRCVGGVCRFSETSVAGELLARAAFAQAEAGESEAASATFELALEAYARARAPVPPDLACSAALAALHVAATPGDREVAARRADLCVRRSAPGDPLRTSVLTQLARLRFDGLDVDAFDAPEAPTRFFTRPPTRPAMESVSFDVEAESRDLPGHARLLDRARATAAQRAIFDCFVADWDTRHARVAEARIRVRFTTRLRDLGDHDTYEPSVAMSAASDPPTPFETCAATALAAAVDSGPSLDRLTMWDDAWVVRVRLP